jgi:hypothetical protein
VLIDAAMPSRPDGWEQPSSGVLAPRIPSGGGEAAALGVEAVAGGIRSNESESTRFGLIPIVDGDFFVGPTCKSRPGKRRRRGRALPMLFWEARGEN